jgi:hypothetical protein
VAVLMTIVLALLISWPWIERLATGDDAHHNLPQRPRNVPVRYCDRRDGHRFYMVLTVASMNGVIARSCTHRHRGPTAHRVLHCLPVGNRIASK